MTIAFRERGHKAWSCDVQPCSGGHPEWHLQQDVLPLLFDASWDMIIAFPPCTHLASSGAKWWGEKKIDGCQDQAIWFFRRFFTTQCPKVAVENPVGIMSSVFRKPDQYIQPWQFGHPETKKTGLWLKGLPKLQPTKNVYEEMLALPKNKRERIFRMPQSQDRAKNRSKTYQGIAQAMAEQWGGDNV